MKRTLLLFTTLLLILGYACKKDKFPEADQPADNSTITIGNSSGMVFTNRDTTINGSDPAATYKIDLNNDLIPDIEFFNSVWTSAGTGMHTSCGITSLDPTVGVYGFNRDDTTFTYTKKDTTYFTNSKRVEIRITHYYDCLRIHPTDDIEEIRPKNFTVPVLMKGSILKTDDVFKSGLVRVYNYGGSHAYTSTIHGDTIIYDSYTSYPYKCSNFPEDKICYVGVKMRTNTIEKIGWIKILIGSWGRSITVLESAMQE